MIQQRAFPQLTRILDAVQRANPMNDESDEDDDLDGDDDDASPSRLFALPGIPGEAKVEMLSDELLERIKQQQSETDGDKVPEAREVDDDEYDDLQETNVQNTEYDEDEISLPPPPPVDRQTFVYSATLTLPASDSYVKSGKRPRGMPDIDGAIAEILEKSRARGKTKVVDLSNSTSNKGGAANVRQGKAPGDEFRLPPGLELYQLKCTQRHKDSYLYAYLMTTEEGSSGPCLVFCNSIAAVRRIGTTLQTLGLDVRILHANMQQVRTLTAI